MQTDKHYVKSILERIDSYKPISIELREELLDHYCTYFESLEQSMTASEALIKTFAAIETDGLTLIKPKSMTTLNRLLTSLAVALCTLFITYMINSEGELIHDPLAGVTMTAQNTIQTDPPSGSPLKDVKLEVSSGFGMKIHPIHKIQRQHKGIDLRAPMGTEVHATGNATVMESDYDKIKGNYIVLQHDEQYLTKYYHLQKRVVQKGEKVQLGQNIGTVGSTGVSTGPHLHYEVIKEGVEMNPSNYLFASNQKINK